MENAKSVADSSKINMHEPLELKCWIKALGVSQTSRARWIRCGMQRLLSEGG